MTEIRQTWMERFVETEADRRLGGWPGIGPAPFGPPPDERTDLHRPAYWMLDLSSYPNAVFNIPYARGGGHPAQRLSLFYPEGFEPGRDAPLPTLIYVHGGGFSGGNAEAEGRHLLYTVEASLYALTRGYAVAAVNYRLKPEAEVLSMIHDVKAAIRYLRANAASLGLDEGRFALLGESAGGYLVNMAGVTGGLPAFRDDAMGYPDVSDRVSAVVSWYSIFDLTDRMLKSYYVDADKTGAEELDARRAMLSPGTYIAKNTPPFLIQHGTRDNEVDYHNSIHLYEALCAATGEENNTLELAANANHAVRWFISRRNGERIVSWLDETLK